MGKLFLNEGGAISRQFAVYEDQIFKDAGEENILHEQRGPRINADGVAVSDMDRVQFLKIFAASLVCRAARRQSRLCRLEPCRRRYRGFQE